MTYRGVRVIISWCVGLVVWTGGSGEAQEAGTQNVAAQAVPEEIKTWVAHTATAQALPPGSYPADQLFGALPPHAPQLLVAETTNGTAPTLTVMASQVYEVPVSDRVHQLAANGDLDDTTRCGRELPFPGLSAGANRAGLKAIWNMLCRNRGGSFEYIAHDLRGSGPNPHRSLVINGRYGFGPQGFGLHAHMLAPGDLKNNQMMAWLPWKRAKAESIYSYVDEMRRSRQGPSIRGERMAGTYVTMEHGLGWEGQYYFYDWTMLGEHPILTVLDSRYTFPRYLPANRWFPDDEWMLRPAFLVVGKRADERAGSGYVALWLDTATFEPLWMILYTAAGSARNITGLTFKWNAEYQRHVMLGESVVELDANGDPEGGTVFEAPFCGVLHYPDRQVKDSDFNGRLLGTKSFSWGYRPAGCE